MSKISSIDVTNYYAPAGSMTVIVNGGTTLLRLSHAEATRFLALAAEIFASRQASLAHAIATARPETPLPGGPVVEHDEGVPF